MIEGRRRVKSGFVGSIMNVKRVIRKLPRNEEARSYTDAGFFLKEKFSRGEAVRQPRLHAVRYYGASPRTRRIGSSFRSHFSFHTNIILYNIICLSSIFPCHSHMLMQSNKPIHQDFIYVMFWAYTYPNLKQRTRQISNSLIGKKLRVLANALFQIRIRISFNSFVRRPSSIKPNFL
jgi:hypothetical protein